MDNSLLDDNLLDDSFGYLNEEEENWQLFLGKKANDYIPIWKQIKQGKKVHFNIFAFLFWAFWLAYRKMYGYAFLLILLNFSLEYIPLILGLSPEFSGLIIIKLIASWGIYIGLSLWGNLLYYQQSMKKIQAIKAKNLDREKEKTALIEGGGTDFVFPIIAFILYVGLIICIFQ